MIDDDEEDTLKYNYKNTFIFRPDLSGPGLTGDEIITMPHPRKQMFYFYLVYSLVKKKSVVEKLTCHSKQFFLDKFAPFFLLLNGAVEEENHSYP